MPTQAHRAIQNVCRFTSLQPEDRPTHRRAESTAANTLIAQGYSKVPFLRLPAARTVQSPNISTLRPRDRVHRGSCGLSLLSSHRPISSVDAHTIGKTCWRRDIPSCLARKAVPAIQPTIVYGSAEHSPQIPRLCGLFLQCVNSASKVTNSLYQTLHRDAKSEMEKSNIDKIFHHASPEHVGATRQTRACWLRISHSTNLK